MKCYWIVYVEEEIRLELPNNLDQKLNKILVGCWQS